MKLWDRAAPAVLVVSLAGGGAAGADVTAEEVWSSWKSVIERSGESVTATEERSGESLILRDVTLSLPTSDTGAMTGRIGEITLVEQGDGTVRVEMPQEYPLVVNGSAAGGETLEMAMTVRQPGFSMVVRDDGDAVAYDVTAPDLSVVLDRMVVDGKPADMSGGARIEALRGSYVVGAGEPRRIESDFAADAVRVDMTAVNPEDGVRLVLDAELRDLVSTSANRLPSGMDPSDLVRMLAAGFASEGRFTHADLSYRMQVTEADGTTDIATAADSGAVDFALADGEMAYDVQSKGTRIVMRGPQLPVPEIDLAMDDSRFRIRMPLVESESPRDFALSTRLAGLTVSDGIWAMVDPGGQLPRDPATLVIDLAGTARWLVAIGEPAALQAGAPPIELEALSLKDLQLRLAGADLTGSGNFAFADPDKAALPGLPQPSGTIDLRLEGGNGLLDRLVAMGLVPQDQATGLRMMVGMFARPGEGSDTLVSRIEVTEDGQVFANGQRLR